MRTKWCSKCKTSKPVSEFNKSKKEKDGLQYWCKDCMRVVNRIHNRKPERIEYNRRILKTSKFKAHLKKYYQQPEVKMKIAMRAREYAQDPKLRIRHQARWLARRNMHAGKIKKHPCEKCGDVNSQIHHPNYTKPLMIIWLCVKCHRELHKKLKAKGGV